MATNLKADGDVLDYVAGATIASGAVVVTGDLVGVALKSMVSGDTAALAIKGVWEVAKATGTAWVQGDSLDWDDSASEFDKAIAVPAAGDVENCCVAYEAAASGAVLAKVRLTPGTGTTT